MEAVDVVEEVWLNPFDDSVAKSFQSHLFIRNSMPRQRARVDDGMSEIVRLPKLKRLVLVGTDIGDAGMRHVGALTELEELDLWGTSVSDASVDVLAGLQKLKKLYLTDTQMTSDGISRLRDALPKCDIYGLLPAAPDGLESRDLEIERILHGPRSGDTWAP
jgi:hypothetical protein